MHRIIRGGFASRLAFFVLASALGYSLSGCGQRPGAAQCDVHTVVETRLANGGWTLIPTQRSAELLIELDDGHVYDSQVLGGTIDTFPTASHVMLCTATSKVYKRPFYSIRGLDNNGAATLAYIVQ